MSFYVNNKYRIRRAESQQDMMQKLTSGNKIFSSYRDILVLSAIVGYCNKAYIPFERSAEGVLMQFFTETDYDLIDLIAYAHAKEQAILKEDGKYEIFESYANGGFPILMKLLEIDEETTIDSAMQEAILVKLASIQISNQIIVNE